MGWFLFFLLHLPETFVMGKRAEEGGDEWMKLSHSDVQ